jgi:hypothetical protein
MSLGSDHETCTGRLSGAMRQRLEAREPGTGANVDHDDVRPNFEALGEGVYRILTEDARVSSALAQDPAFWAWVGQLTALVAELRSWQVAVEAAVAAWDPASPASGVVLRNAVTAQPSPRAVPAAPGTLLGRLT